VDPEIEKELDVLHDLKLTSLEGLLVHAALRIAEDQVGTSRWFEQADKFWFFGVDAKLGIPPERMAAALGTLRHKLDTCG